MSSADLRLTMPGLFLLRGRYRVVHMIGVLGAGMAALAEILVRSGFSVSGTDPKGGAGKDYLSGLGVAIASRPAAGNVPPEALVVHSAAVPSSHPELRTARRRRQPILPRGGLLALLMRGASGIAVAGSHGKSTTAGLIAYLLSKGGLSPVAAVGARLPGQRGNALVGPSPILVAEVDESDGTIERVEPMAVVLTSIDREHLDRFSGSFRELQAAFRRLAMRVPVSGAVIVPGDDDRALRLVRTVLARSISAGLREGSLVKGEGVSLARGRYGFTLRYRGKRVCKTRIALPGLMNVKNALLAAAVGLLLGLSGREIASGLAEFPGVGRRFERLGRFRGIDLVDDYAHHPAEIAATIAAAREFFPGRRLAVLFEPHRQSRMARHLASFAKALSEADLVTIAPLFSAFERSQDRKERDRLAPELVRRLRGGGVEGSAASTLSGAVETALSRLRKGDVLIVMGAGKADEMAQLVLGELRPGGRGA